jgi:hypothetical protein
MSVQCFEEKLAKNETLRRQVEEIDDRISSISSAPFGSISY